MRQKKRRLIPYLSSASYTKSGNKISPHTIRQNTYMSTLLHAAANLLLLRDPQWVDHPILSTSTSTSTADFSIATVPNPPPPSSMDGAVYDAFPAASVTSTLAAALATGAAQVSSSAAAAASAMGSGSPHDGSGDDRGECRLLGPFALFVQLALGGLALMSLVYKRWRERPQRPLKIWFFDASKQVFGSVLVHMANVFMSMLTSGRFSVTVEPAAVSTAAALVRRFASAHGGGGPGAGGGDEYTPNPCSFYLLNLAIDVSFWKCYYGRRGFSCAVSFLYFTDNMILLSRPRSAYQSSSSFYASSPVSCPTHPWAALPSRYSPATMAARPGPGGG